MEEIIAEVLLAICLTYLGYSQRKLKSKTQKHKERTRILLETVIQHSKTLIDIQQQSSKANSENNPFNTPPDKLQYD